MSFAVPEFNMTCRTKEQNSRTPSYFDRRYDIKFIFTPVDSCDNVLLRINNALAGMLNQTVKLPRIIVLMLD